MAVLLTLELIIETSKNEINIQQNWKTERTLLLHLLETIIWLPNYIQFNHIKWKGKKKFNKAQTSHWIKPMLIITDKFARIYKPIKERTKKLTTKEPKSCNLSTEYWLSSSEMKHRNTASVPTGTKTFKLFLRTKSASLIFTSLQ